MACIHFFCLFSLNMIILKSTHVNVGISSSLLITEQ